MIERNGMVNAKALKSNTKAEVMPYVMSSLDEKAVVYTDESPIY